MPIPGMGGGLPGAGSLTYQSLQSKYKDFGHPRAQVQLGGAVFNSTGNDMVVSDFHVELSAGYEASVATFRLYDVFDTSTGKFEFEKIKKQVMMGNSVNIAFGYLGGMETVFVGFVSGVAFGYEPEGLPYIEITAMDVKGLMMGGTYATQLKATTYSAAVKEILNRTGEGVLQQLGGISEAPAVTNTPDAGGAAARVSPAPGSPAVPTPPPVPMAGGTPKSSPITVEMVSESDYEFVVRAAKRYNFEFFVDRGKVLFRPAKADSSILMKLGIRAGIQTFHIQYSITGVVGEIQARAMDPGKGQLIEAKSKFNSTISTANKAKTLVGKGAKVYLDASIGSKEEAEARVASLMEQMSYRLGSVEAECIGIPELVPGRFIEVSGMGVPVDNQFYLTRVTHDFTSDNGFKTRIEGCAAKVQTTAAPGAGGGLPRAGGGLGGLL